MGLNSIRGRVVSGMGKGESFLQMPVYKEKIRELTGFEAFAGTLNLQISENEYKHFSLALEKITVEEFESDGQTRGGFDLYKIRFPDSTSGAIIAPHQSTHLPNIIEIIASFSLREKFNLNDNDLFEIKLGK